MTSSCVLFTTASAQWRTIPRDKCFDPDRTLLVQVKFRNIYILRRPYLLVNGQADIFATVNSVLITVWATCPSSGSSVAKRRREVGVLRACTWGVQYSVICRFHSNIVMKTTGGYINCIRGAASPSVSLTSSGCKADQTSRRYQETYFVNHYLTHWASYRGLTY